jgi:hypothetical protein
MENKKSEKLQEFVTVCFIEFRKCYGYICFSDRKRLTCGEKFTVILHVTVQFGTLHWGKDKKVHENVMKQMFHSCK